MIAYWANKIIRKILICIAFYCVTTNSAYISSSPGCGIAQLIDSPFIWSQFGYAVCIAVVTHKQFWILRQKFLRYCNRLIKGLKVKEHQPFLISIFPGLGYNILIVFHYRYIVAEDHYQMLFT